MQITVTTTVRAPLAEVWRAWTTPADIIQWNAASDDWHTTASTVDLRVGGRFSSRMEARDGSMGFDFEGHYTEVEPHQRIAFRIGDREVHVEFEETPAGIVIRETFDAESVHPIEHQQAGWQAILDRFTRHVESQHVD